MTLLKLVTPQLDCTEDRKPLQGCPRGGAQGRRVRSCISSLSGYVLRAAVTTVRVRDATRCDATLNERPSAESAPAEAPETPADIFGISWSGVASQAGSVIVPDTLFAVAA